MILRKDYVQQIQNGLAQVEVEKTEEHNEMLNLIFPNRVQYNYVAKELYPYYYKNERLSSGCDFTTKKTKDGLPIIHASDIILDNTVIKVLDEEGHGAMVIAWWEEQGVGTEYEGDGVGDCYGIYNGKFNHYSEKYALAKGKKIITLPEPFPSKQEIKQENKMRTIT